MNIRSGWWQTGRWRIASGVLYCGPLLAGLAGYGWLILPPFVALFLCWQMQERPSDPPRLPVAVLTPQGLVILLTLILTQILLVAVLLGVGRGIGGAADHLPALNPMLPLALSGAALLLPHLAPDRDLPMAPAVPRPPVAQAPLPQGSAAQVIRPLLDFADDAPLAELGPVLEDILDAADICSRLGHLADALEAAPNLHATLRRALVVWATEPGLFVANLAPTAMVTAFRTAGHDPDLLSELLPRAAALARILPERRGQFPDAAALQALEAAGLSGPLANDLGRLMEALGLRRAPRRFRNDRQIGQIRTV